MFSLSFLAVVVVLAGAGIARPLAEHEPPSARRLPSRRWYHDEGHPALQLFRRDLLGSLPAVGTPEWKARFPKPGQVPTQSPDAWLTALNASIAAGLIPTDVPLATGNGPYYPSGVNGYNKPICSASFGCNTEDDILNAPPGVLALSFDDGPYNASGPLYDFLFDQGQVATHFMIGTSIIESPDLFTTAFARNGDDIAVHTWSHQYCTTLTNEQIIAEIGWSMQIIHDSTGGRLPKFWRPPHGDVDNRVRAIAKNVFGLTTIIWNYDTLDWKLSDSPPGTTLGAVASKMKKWLSGPKTPGLIILEHELDNKSVNAFIAAYPLMKSNGWDIRSVPDAFDSAWYFNAATSNATLVADMSPVMTTQLAAVNGATPSGSAASSPSPATNTTNGATAMSTSLLTTVFAITSSLVLIATL